MGSDEAEVKLMNDESVIGSDVFGYVSPEAVAQMIAVVSMAADKADTDSLWNEMSDIDSKLPA
jgi:hypothetical protein